MPSIYQIHTTHYSHILTNQNILFLRDIHTKSWYGHADVLDDLILSGLKCAFSCMFQYSLCHGMYMGTVTLYIDQQHPCHHFLDRILFHHAFHHDSCDYHWDFYGH